MQHLGDRVGRGGLDGAGPGRGAGPSAARSARIRAALGFGVEDLRAIVALIENEVARGIAYDRIVLAGFSQGCAMALHTALRLPHTLAGIMALSGYLPLADRTRTERQRANAHTPIFMAHGTMDPVVAVTRGEDSRDALVALGHPVQWHTYPMQHAVHPHEIADIAAFLKQVLEKPVHAA